MLFRLSALVLIILAAASAFYFPLKIPYSVETFGRVMPLRELLLTRAANGLQSALKNNKTGALEAFSAFNFERGDPIEFELHSSIYPGRSIAVGDTLGLLLSDENRRRLVRLENDLGMARAALAALRAGEKTAVIESARQQLVYAETQLAQQKNKMARIKPLIEGNHLSQEELEIEENLLHLYAVEVDIAKAQLAAVQTGVKTQQLEQSAEQVAGFERELDLLLHRLQDLHVLSPMAGQVATFFSPDTLMAVRDTAEYILALPLRWREFRSVVQGQKVQISLPDGTEVLAGSIARKTDLVATLNGEQVFVALASVPRRTDMLIPGLLVPCKIPGEDIDLLEYLRRAVVQ